MTPLPPLAAPAPAARKSTPLDAAATDRLEASFLEEMLKYAGPRTATDPLSGEGGESQFQSFLSQQYAARIAARIDLRLAPGGGA